MRVLTFSQLNNDLAISRIYRPVQTDDTESIASPEHQDTVEFWANEILNIELQMSVLMLNYNALKAELSFARVRHRQVVRKNKVAAQGILSHAECCELLRSQDDPEPQGPCPAKRRAPIDEGSVPDCVEKPVTTKKSRIGFVPRQFRSRLLLSFHNSTQCR